MRINKIQQSLNLLIQALGGLMNGCGRIYSWYHVHPCEKLSEFLLIEDPIVVEVNLFEEWREACEEFLMLL